MKKKKFWTMRRKRAVLGLIFISPWLIGFCWFYLRSLAMSVMFSLSDIQIKIGEAGYESVFAGLKHYKYAFLEHGQFKEVLTSSILYILVDVPLIIFFSLFIAILLNRKFKGRTLTRIIFFLPVLLNSQAINAAISMARAFMLGGVSPASPAMSEAAGMGTSGSIINMTYYMEIFSDLAIPEVLIDYIIGAVTQINHVITASGVQIIIFLAALQSVPGALYEVSKIEGATAYETFWKVTLPIVSPLIVTNIVYTVIDTFVNTDIVTLSYTTVFTNYNYPLGSVISLVSSVAVCLILVVACTAISKLVYYEN
jgi:ABC-type sugar transport system permease subunit